MEEIIQQLLSGQISMRTFLDLIFSDPDLVSEVNKLVPEDSKNNANHPIWMKFSYEAMKKVNFLLWDEIKSIAVFDDSLGDNLNIFGNIRIFYCYSHPEFQPTAKYKEEYGFLLDIAGEKYGGPEVDKLINDIVSQYLSITPKSRRIREAKEKLKSLFHISEKKYPYWINGAEWPMGVSSPMQFVDAKSIKDGKIFRFRDVDTGDLREIHQYY